jgi:hypothetical protein
MNCDPFGCGVPVYSTIDKSGNRLLGPDEIYSLWLDALAAATDAYESMACRENNVSIRHDPRLSVAPTTAAH